MNSRQWNQKVSVNRLYRVLRTLGLGVLDYALKLGVWGGFWIRRMTWSDLHFERTSLAAVLRIDWRAGVEARPLGVCSIISGLGSGWWQWKWSGQNPDIFKGGGKTIGCRDERKDSDFWTCYKGIIPPSSQICHSFTCWRNQEWVHEIGGISFGPWRLVRILLLMFGAEERAFQIKEIAWTKVWK